MVLHSRASMEKIKHESTNGENSIKSALRAAKSAEMLAPITPLRRSPLLNKTNVMDGFHKVENGATDESTTKSALKGKISELVAQLQEKDGTSRYSLEST